LAGNSRRKERTERLDQLGGKTPGLGASGSTNLDGRFVPTASTMGDDTLGLDARQTATKDQIANMDLEYRVDASWTRRQKALI